MLPSTTVGTAVSSLEPLPKESSPEPVGLSALATTSARMAVPDPAAHGDKGGDCGPQSQCSPAGAFAAAGTICNEAYSSSLETRRRHANHRSSQRLPGRSPHSQWATNTGTTMPTGEALGPP